MNHYSLRNKTISRAGSLILALVFVFSVIFGNTYFVSGNKATAEEVADTEKPFVILYTNDVHCAVDDNIGYAGLSAYKNKMIKEGNDVLTVDCGDYISGGVMGLIANGDPIIQLMNAVGYDVTTLGNHEFDHGISLIPKLVEKAEFPIVSSTYVDTRNGETVLDPYVIKEAGGKKFAFIGISTPETISATSLSYFLDENGKQIYDFCGGDSTDGSKFYAQVQKYVNKAKDEGADYCIALCHLGDNVTSYPYRSEDLVENTYGLDVVFDGHSHSVVEGDTYKNKLGEDVIVSQTGTKLENIGKLTYDAETGFKTQLISSDSFTEKDDKIIAELENLNEQHASTLNEVCATSEFELATHDDVGNRISRIKETNLGDLIADSFRDMTGSDIGLINGGSIRSNIAAGDITFKNILEVLAFCNNIVKVEVTGQELADELEYSVHSAPEEFGGFLHVSGLTFDVDLGKQANIITDSNGIFSHIGEGDRRVSNIKVNGEDLDLTKTYTVGGADYLLFNNGDSHKSFEDRKVEMDQTYTDSELLKDYLKTKLGKVIPEKYSNIYGEGRINFSDSTEDVTPPSPAVTPTVAPTTAPKTTVTTPAAATATTTPTASAVSSVFSAGDKLTHKGIVYKIMYSNNVFTLRVIKIKKSKKNISVPNAIYVSTSKIKVTSIKAKAFRGDKKLVKMTLGKSLKTIGNNAYKNCKKLTTLVVKNKSLYKKLKVDKNRTKAGIAETVEITK